MQGEDRKEKKLFTSGTYKVLRDRSDSCIAKACKSPTGFEVKTKKRSSFREPTTFCELSVIFYHCFLQISLIAAVYTIKTGDPQEFLGDQFWVTTNGLRSM